MKSIAIALLCLISVSVHAQAIFDAESVVEFQQRLNSNFRDSVVSPLMKSDIKSFKELDFYPIDTTFFAVAKVERTPAEKPFKMTTTTSRLPEYVKYAILHFTLNGKDCKLNLYRNVELSKKAGYENYLFLPFSDLTNGDQSYIGGRYIDVKIPEGDTMAIDFNKAYNPYCAYNYAYSCPKVPLENDLPIAIKAGVKKFHD